MKSGWTRLDLLQSWAGIDSKQGLHTVHVGTVAAPLMQIRRRLLPKESGSQEAAPQQLSTPFDRLSIAAYIVYWINYIMLIYRKRIHDFKWYTDIGQSRSEETRLCPPTPRWAVFPQMRLDDLRLIIASHHLTWHWFNWLLKVFFSFPQNSLIPQIAIGRTYNICLLDVLVGRIEGRNRSLTCDTVCSVVS